MNEEANSRPLRRERSIAELADGILQSNRALLAQSITLIESNASKHFDKGQELINQILPHTGQSIRIGITGVPGAGKSTFIEAFGMYLCELGHRVSVLAIDPSSSVTGGSILGDKTRMDQLSRHKSAFVRPSPTSGTLGGVARKTRESILLCEAAGYDVIIVETVGVGQSEVAVKSMVDVFVLLALTGGGDELQGMKKGIMELVDLLVINKADGDNEKKALKAKEEFERILHFLRPRTRGWIPKAFACSSIHGVGIDRIWETIKEYEHVTKEQGTFFSNRDEQMKDWFYSLIKYQLEESFLTNPYVKKNLPLVEASVLKGEYSASLGVKNFFEQLNKQER